MLGRVHWLHAKHTMKFDMLFKAAVFGAGVGAGLVYVAMRRPKP